MQTGFHRPGYFSSRQRVKQKKPLKNGYLAMIYNYNVNYNNNSDVSFAVQVSNLRNCLNQRLRQLLLQRLSTIFVRFRVMKFLIEHKQTV